MLFALAFVAGGFMLGLALNRWWAFAAPFAVGLYVYLDAEGSRFGHSDIPWGVVATAYGVWTAVGVLAGVLARRVTRRFARLSY